MLCYAAEADPDLPAAPLVPFANSYTKQFTNGKNGMLCRKTKLWFLRGAQQTTPALCRQVTLGEGGAGSMPLS